MAVTFRQAASEDFQAICDLILDEEELFLVYPEGRYPLTVEQIQKLFRRRIEPTVLLTDGKLAGFACFYGYKKERSVFIGNVVIDQSQRGKGLGEEIVNHMIDLAFWKYELPRVRISVYNRNTTALLLYGSLGFKPYGMNVEQDYIGERVVNLHLRLKRSAATFTPLRERS